MVQPCGYRQYAGDIGIDARCYRHQHGYLCRVRDGIRSRRPYIATLGLITPGIIIILIIAKILEKFKESRYVQWALYGLEPLFHSAVIAAPPGLSVVQISLIHYKLIGQSGIAVLDIFDIKGIILAVVILTASRISTKTIPSSGFSLPP